MIKNTVFDLYNSEYSMYIQDQYYIYLFIYFLLISKF